MIHPPISGFHSRRSVPISADGTTTRPNIGTSTRLITGAIALGMGRLKTIKCIVIPQVIRLVIPSWSNELISLLKFSSLAYLIQFPELLFQTKFIASKNYRMFEMSIITGILYLTVVLIISHFLRKLERKLRIPGLGTGSTF